MPNRDERHLEQALGRDLAAHLTPMMSRRRLETGERLITEGQPSPTLFAVVHGALEVQRATAGEVLVLGRIEAGTLVGEVGFLDRGPATATLVALEPCLLLAIEPEALPRLQREAPELAGLLLQRLAVTMAERLDQTGQTLSEQLPEERPRRRDRVRRLFGQLLGVS